MTEDDHDDTLAEGYLVRLNGRVWGTALGFLCSLGLFMATVILLLKGGDDVGAMLGRLEHFMPGYDVTWGGAFIGAGYGFVIGLVVGNVICFVYNASARKR